MRWEMSVLLYSSSSLGLVWRGNGTNAKVLSAVLLRGRSGCVCTSKQRGTSSGSDGSVLSTAYLHANLSRLQAHQCLLCLPGTTPGLCCLLDGCLDAVELTGT